VVILEWVVLSASLGRTEPPSLSHAHAQNSRRDIAVSRMLNAVSVPVPRPRESRFRKLTSSAVVPQGSRQGSHQVPYHTVERTQCSTSGRSSQLLWQNDPVIPGDRAPRPDIPPRYPTPGWGCDDTSGQSAWRHA